MKRLIGFMVMVLGWEVLSRISPSPIIVSIPEIFRASVAMILSGELTEHAAVSLLRVVLGFSIASVSGIVLGILIYEYKSIEVIMTPVVDAVRPIAAMTIFPIIVVLLGIGQASKVFVIFWTAWPAVLLNTVQALRQVDKQVLEAASLDGADRWASMLHVVFPLALPTVMTGLRIGLSGGWIALVSGEMLGSNSGLGFAVLMYSNAFRYADMYTCILAIALLGLVMNLSFAGIQSMTESETGVQHEKSKLLSFGDRSAGWPFGGLFSKGNE